METVMMETVMTETVQTAEETTVEQTCVKGMFRRRVRHGVDRWGMLVGLFVGCLRVQPPSSDAEAAYASPTARASLRPQAAEAQAAKPSRGVPRKGLKAWEKKQRGARKEERHKQALERTDSCWKWEKRTTNVEKQGRSETETNATGKKEAKNVAEMDEAGRKETSEEETRKKERRTTQRKRGD
ncbi:UNVERIFIED_CONTAM: hypothetical protein HHA_461630 [Hammondia hammondi]|eukprot:XP_008882182.1 hypothetical protein HHA_461630 [Hammondia hammondi]